MLWLWSGPPESYWWFSYASAFQLFLAVESSRLFYLCIRFDFYVRWWVRKPFTLTDQMSCVYHDRTKGEWPRKIDLSPNTAPHPPPPHPSSSNIFTDRSKAVLLLWFTIFVTVCLCMFVIVFLGRNCPFDFLPVGFSLWCRYFKCVLLSLWCPGTEGFR